MKREMYVLYELVDDEGNREITKMKLDDYDINLTSNRICLSGNLVGTTHERKEFWE